MSKKRKKTAGQLVPAGGSPVPAQLLADLRALIEAGRARVAQAVNVGMVLLYWEIGQRIRTEVLKAKRAAYGEQILRTLSEQLTAEYGRGFGMTSLSLMLRFAEVFPDRQTVQTLAGQVGWSHFQLLIPLTDALKRDFYAEMCRIEHWSVRTLRAKIRKLCWGLLGPPPEHPWHELFKRPEPLPAPWEMESGGSPRKRPLPALEPEVPTQEEPKSKRSKRKAKGFRPSPAANEQGYFPARESASLRPNPAYTTAEPRPPWRTTMNDDMTKMSEEQVIQRLCRFVLPEGKSVVEAYVRSLFQVRHLLPHVNWTGGKPSARSLPGRSGGKRRWRRCGGMRPLCAPSAVKPVDAQRRAFLLWLEFMRRLSEDSPSSRNRRISEAGEPQPDGKILEVTTEPDRMAEVESEGAKPKSRSNHSSNQEGLEKDTRRKSL